MSKKVLTKLFLMSSKRREQSLGKFGIKIHAIWGGWFNSGGCGL